MIQWTDYDHCFCEGKMYGLPEYYNSFSSIIICMFALIGLFIPNYKSIKIQILYGSLFSTGIGSIMYHYTAYKGWAHVDEISMLFAIGLGLTFLTDIYLFYIHQNNININKLYISTIIFTLIFTICLSIMEYHRLLFPLYFIFFVLIIVYALNSIIKIINIEPYNIDNIILHKFYKYSIYIGLLSAVFWFTTELICNYYHHPILLIGHPLWHITSAYTAHCIIQIMLYLKYYNLSRNVVYFRMGGIYNYIPIVDVITEYKIL
jgi:hypothetical protein